MPVRFRVLALEIGLIISAIVVSSGFSIYAHFKMTQIATTQIAMKVEELNIALGEAIQMVQTGSEQMENPLLTIISKVLDKEIERPISARVVEKDESGKFVKKIE